MVSLTAVAFEAPLTTKSTSAARLMNGAVSVTRHSRSPVPLVAAAVAGSSNAAAAQRSRSSRTSDPGNSEAV